MLTEVDVIGVRPSLAPLELRLFEGILEGAGDSPIQIKKIDGLGPVVAALSIEESSEDTDRNIVLDLGLRPDWSEQTFTSLRQELYKYFMPKLSVTLQFISTHLPTCEITGIVESMTDNMFSADPEVQISIICTEPDFVAVEPIEESGVTVNGTITEVIDYEGTKPAGFLFRLQVTPTNPAYAGNLALSMEYLDLETFNVTTPLVSNYFFELSTVYGNKYVRKVLAVDPDVYISILNQVTGVPDWLTLNPGENEFKLAVTEADLSWSLLYYARYGGL